MTYIFDLGVIYSGAAYFFCGFLLLISFQLYSGQTQHKEQPQNTAFELYIYKASNYMAMHGQIIGFVPCAWQPEESSQNLLEVTPLNIRLRKKILKATFRKK